MRLFRQAQNIKSAASGKGAVKKLLNQIRDSQKREVSDLFFKKISPKERVTSLTKKPLKTE
jgi:hypothetical protein